LIDNPLGYDITDSDQQFNNESRLFIVKYSYNLPQNNALHLSLTFGEIFLFVYHAVQ